MIDPRHELRGAQACEHVVVRDDQRAIFAKADITIGVVPMPMRVDEYFRRCIADFF